MIRGAFRAIRFWRMWGTSGAGVESLETRIERDGRSLPATLYLPPGPRRNLPAWVLLHGITVPGRKHEVLVRFARALAGTGAAVLTPEIPEWTALRLDPEPSATTIRASSVTLEQHREIASDRLGVIGFSFGAPQAILASADESLAGRVRLVVGFGGYCDLRRLLRFMFTGEHEWEGVTRRLRPDPYGRWIVGANYLTGSERYRDFHETARALHRLATAAGERRLASWDPSYDPVKAELRGALPEHQRPLFDLFAPPAASEPDPQAAMELIDYLLTAMHETSDLMEPAGHLAGVTSPVRLLHGVGDHLIPYTESLRLAEAFPDGADVRVSLTGLFSHSSADGGGGLLANLRQAGSLGLELTRIFEAV